MTAHDWIIVALLSAAWNVGYFWGRWRASRRIAVLTHCLASVQFAIRHGRKGEKQSRRPETKEYWDGEKTATDRIESHMHHRTMIDGKPVKLEPIPDWLPVEGAPEETP